MVEDCFSRECSSVSQSQLGNVPADIVVMNYDKVLEILEPQLTQCRCLDRAGWILNLFHKGLHQCRQIMVYKVSLILFCVV